MADQTDATAQHTAPPPATAAPPSPTHDTPAAPGARRRTPMRRVLLVVAPILVGVAAWLAYAIYREGLQYVSTDNAQLAGQAVQVGSINAGRLETVHVSVGSRVHRGDVLAEVALPSQTGTAQSGQPRLSFLGPGDSRVEVAAPLDGVVIAVSAAVGATLQPGQPIVAIVDPGQLWVTANIDETSIGRVKVGQGVQIHLDALNQDVPGKVQTIIPATASTFSLLPTSSGSGSFTKITQLVPVRIALFLDAASQQSLLGSSAEIKIRVQD
jgi:multidrug resistance efflux pump